MGKRAWREMTNLKSKSYQELNHRLMYPNTGELKPLKVLDWEYKKRILNFILFWCLFIILTIGTIIFILYWYHWFLIRL